MKKISLFSVLFLSLLVFSCNNAESPVEEVVVEEVVEETAVVVENVEGIPNFESEELTSFTKDFDVYFNKSMELLKAGNMEALAAMEKEGEALQVRAEELKNSVSEGDKVLLEEYLKGKAKEMLSASGLDKLGEKFEESSNK